MFVTADASGSRMDTPHFVNDFMLPNNYTIFKIYIYYGINKTQKT
jgi:hypothetical protein